MAKKNKAPKKRTTPITPPAPAEAATVQAAAAPQPAAPAAAVGPRFPAVPLPTGWRLWAPLGLMVVLLLVNCISGSSSLKTLVMVLIVASLASCLLKLGELRDRFTLPVLAVCLWMLMNGISVFYAVSGMFALQAFDRLLVGFGVFLLILAWSPDGAHPGRGGASILEGSVALASLVSIDLLSTQLLAKALYAVAGLFSGGVAAINMDPVEAGVRMLSIYDNPNAFAGVSGLGVLLSLGLAISADTVGERRFHQVCLFLNALGFVLAFSMGASGMIALAFLVLLLAEAKERKAPLFLLMVETLVLTLLCAFPIFLTSFDAWDGIQPIPLLCAVGGSALLCVVDQFVGQKVSHALAGKGKVLGLAVGAIVAALALFAVAAVTLTGPAKLADGEALRRADYPDAGAYTLSVEADRPDALQVTIESQNQQDTMMHTSTVLYQGPAQGASFTVPEDSMVVYFDLYAQESDLTVDSVAFQGENGSGELKLNYKLLPGFIANRLQGLFANQNAIQRTVFFADGMKLFRRSPVFGLGLGAYESAICSVQSFYYETRFAHNHYVESLVTTGVVGLALFVGMLALCGLALLKNLRRKEGTDPLAPALLAALVFMAGHAAVEIVFSHCFYLPTALGVLGLICLCCGGELPLLKDRENVRTWGVLGVAGLLAVFGVILALNLTANKIMRNRTADNFYDGLETAIRLDLLEKDNLMLTYVYNAQDRDPIQDSAIRMRADHYAQVLSERSSNSIHHYLAGYYLATDRPDVAMGELEKHVTYSASSSETWQESLDLLEAYSVKYPEACKAEALKLQTMIQEWNEANMGTITLTAENQAFLAAAAGE